MGSNGGNLFFQLVNACYERCGFILTSNRSFGEWGGSSGTASSQRCSTDCHAIVVQIEGSSYRLRDHVDLLPDRLRNRSSFLSPAAAEPVHRRPGRPRKSSPDPFGRLITANTPGGEFTSTLVGILRVTLTRWARN
ncbi:ATP-binding protein [Paraburkholderia sp. RL17-373-BIF-A]